MKRVIAILFVLALGSAKVASAQDYNWAIGVRGGGVLSGVTVKYNFDPANSVEGLLDFTQGFNVVALYERHIPVISDGFRFYYGAGVNMGAWHRWGGNPFTMGIDGIIGLEYKIRTIPLAFSIDYKPLVNFAGRTGFYGLDFGLGVKVAF